LIESDFLVDELQLHFLNRILGGRVTEDHNEMTHLVMTCPARSLRAIFGLCKAKHILKSAWLTDSINVGYLLPEESYYWITDVGNGFKCDVPAVLKSPMRQKLFENRVFFITPSVKPSPAALKWIIEQCGGKWEQNRRSILKISELNNQMPNSYIIISCPEDLYLLGANRHFICYVCTPEFILQSVMSQNIDFLKSELQLTR